MDQVAPITHHAELISRLGPTLPPELCRLALPQAMGHESTARNFTFGFVWRELPFTGIVEATGSAARLAVMGSLGPLPFTAEDAKRRQRARRALAEANRQTRLEWQLSPKHEILVGGVIELARPLSPGRMIAAAVAMLLPGDGYLALLLDVLGDADSLNLAAAA
jgi:hypothetical protein